MLLSLIFKALSAFSFIILSHAKDPFSFDADLDPGSALEKMDPDPDPGQFEP